MFEPSANSGASGLADSPRPFVFRVHHLDRCTIPAGSAFHFDFHLFDMLHPSIELLVRTFAELAQEGLGPGRGRAELCDVSGADAPLVLSLAPSFEPVRRVTVRFITPTELKTAGGLAAEPDFGVLATRIRDRLSTLRALYDAGPLPIDFLGFGERAARVSMTRCEIRQVETVRRSSRTGQVHSLGGLVGEAQYEGDLTEFLPYLEAATWTGVGRQTVWGKGALEVTDSDAVNKE